MSGKTTHSVFSDTMLSSASSSSLFPIDESPDFHDPYSDLSLFLSQKIKQEMSLHGSAKKWSVKIQEELIRNITPDFQKQFPHYRLGVSALKKTWEKISAYIHHIQTQPGAISQDGKLNVHFFIKENFRSSDRFRYPFHLPAYTYAHQLAVKISECIATVDGIRPKLDHLVKLIWSVQRHLLKGMNFEQGKSPYDEYDQLDKLVVKMVLEISAERPNLKHSELEYEVKKAIHSLQEMADLADLNQRDLPLSVAARLRTEIGNAIIDNPREAPESIAQIAWQFFKRIQGLRLKEQQAELERKIHHWTIQGDMLCKSIRLDHGAPLLKFIIEEWKGKEAMAPEAFMQATYKAYLAKRPELAPYTAQLQIRTRILFKYCWYTVFAGPEESSLDRFVKWQTAQNPSLDKEGIKKVCEECLPLVPSEFISVA